MTFSEAMEASKHGNIVSGKGRSEVVIAKSGDGLMYAVGKNGPMGYQYDFASICATLPGLKLAERDWQPVIKK